MCDKQSLRSACTYAQSDQSLCLSLEYHLTVKLLTEHHLRFLSLKGGLIDSSESATLLEITCHGSLHRCRSTGLWVSSIKNKSTRFPANGESRLLMIFANKA